MSSTGDLDGSEKACWLSVGCIRGPHVSEPGFPRGSFCPQLLVSRLAYSLTLKIEAVYLYEISVDFYLPDYTAARPRRQYKENTTLTSSNLSLAFTLSA